jgi:hypothetical protein
MLFAMDYLIFGDYSLIALWDLSSHSEHSCMCFTLGFVFLCVCFTGSEEVRVKVFLEGIVLKHDSMFASLVLKRFM